MTQPVSIARRRPPAAPDPGARAARGVFAVLAFIATAGVSVIAAAIGRISRGEVREQDWTGEMLPPSAWDAASSWWLLCVTVGTFWWVTRRWHLSRRTRGFDSGVPGLGPARRRTAAGVAVLLMLIAHLLMPALLQHLFIFDQHPNQTIVTGWGTLRTR